MEDNKAWVAPMLDSRVPINTSHPLELVAFKKYSVSNWLQIKSQQATDKCKEGTSPSDQHAQAYQYPQHECPLTLLPMDPSSRLHSKGFEGDPAVLIKLEAV